MAIIVKGGGGKPEEEKTVTAGTSVIEVSPSSGKVMKKVTVNPTPTETKEVSPTATDQTYNPPEGKHFSQFTVKGDSDLVGENIKQGVNIFGVDGSFDNSNGAYVWKKLTAEGGDLVDFVVSDNETAYPDGGEQGGYWYELYGKPLKIVTWAGGTDEEIVAMVEAADRGKINLSDYWAVGDTRTVQLSSMLATGVGESHAAQAVDLVLMHAGGYDLNEAVASGRTECSFVVGLKDSLAEAGYMNNYDGNSGSWNGSERRTWCNNVFRNAIPSTLRAIFKQFKTVTAQTYDGSTNQTSVDYFALPAEREIFNVRNCSNTIEYSALFQFEYYHTASNRVKKLGKTGTASIWWERSPYYGYSAHFCFVHSDGSANSNNASYSYGLAPFGCI